MRDTVAAAEPGDLASLGDRGSESGPATAKLTGISKFFSGVTALADVSVEFRPGEVHAILGENGAGKSTLMNIISGTLQPDGGVIEFEGRRIASMSPDLARSLGIAISFQHPAILDDLSVLENLRVALPRTLFDGKSPQAVAQAMLDAVGLDIALQGRADSLTVAQKHLLEIAKAMAIRPKVLILDEPTASLDQEATDMLFGRIRDVVRQGTSVIYITHRLAEIRQIAQRVTVLRDGRLQGSALVDEITDEALLRMIVGRHLGSTFPPKSRGGAGDINLRVEALSGNRVRDVSFEVARGEIIGVAGVEGNGQSELMRILAGLEAFQGSVTLKGRTLSQQELQQEAAFMPSDRHAEGLAGGLTVRENAALGALEKFATNGILSRKKELDSVTATFRSLAVKAPSIEAPVLSLSGGNQQKVVMARALLSEPGLIVADEPTQGVDVGARAEIYRILREVSDSGTPVVVNSSDAAELEGLCDRVIVMSRGRVVETLTGDDVVEARIVAAAVSAVTHHDAGQGAPERDKGRGRSGLRHFVQTDNAPAIPLAIVTVLLGLLVFSQNVNFLSFFNISNMLLLATALGFIALGQTVAIMSSGIDLSVGPLAGFLVVIASFFVLDGQPAMTVAMGFVLMFVAAAVIGAINGTLIRFANFTPIAATLAMYIGLQGCSFLLRDGPDGYIRYDVIEMITWSLGPVPVAFIVMVAFAIAAEYALRRLRPGWQLRAVGSDEESARRIGIHVDRTVIAAYVASSLFTALGAIMLMAQIGVGDPQQGASYTLASITAVVLGGTSLRGGRGTFFGTLLAAVLLTEVLNAISFLGLSQTYQYVFQGGLILFAALVYSTVRGRAR
jgi:ribose transport system ATP-binding protein